MKLTDLGNLKPETCLNCNKYENVEITIKDGDWRADCSCGTRGSRVICCSGNSPIQVLMAWNEDSCKMRLRQIRSKFDEYRSAFANGDVSTEEAYHLLQEISELAGSPVEV